MAQLSYPGVSPASPSSGVPPAAGTGTSSSLGSSVTGNAPSNSTGDFNSFNNTTTGVPNTFNFGDGTGFGNLDSGTGNSLQNSSFGPTTPLAPQNFGTITPNTMQPGNQFNNPVQPGNPNLAPNNSLPQSSPGLQAEEFEVDQFEQRRPGF